MDTPGVKILGAMEVMGEDHAPIGHMHLKFDNVRVPKDNILLGEGRGFEISQVRLGPGRIHHCMRSIGKAELALEMMVKRAGTRNAFGKNIPKLGKNLEVISRARLDLDAMRRMVLQAAKAMDLLGNKEARVHVSAGKAEGARKSVPDYRPGHPDAWCHRYLTMDAARRHVRPPASSALRRRPR